MGRAVLAGLGRAIAEVGPVMIAGGNPRRSILDQDFFEHDRFVMFEVPRSKEKRHSSFARVRPELRKFGFVLVQLRAVSRLKLPPALRVMAEPTTKLRRGRYLFHPEIECRALLGDAARP